MPKVTNLRIIVEGTFAAEDDGYWPREGEGMLLTSDRYDEAPYVLVQRVQPASEADDYMAEAFRREAAMKAAWTALDLNDIPGAYDALDID